MEGKARISVNGKTGEREFIYQNQLKQMSGYLQNMDGENQIRPSKMLWQLPYDERQSFMESQFEAQFNGVQRMSKLFQQNYGVKLQRQQSSEFDQADRDDSDFEEMDDFIEEDEEFGGANRAVKLSIRALNFNMMLSEKNDNSFRRVSLLSRASGLMAGCCLKKNPRSRPSQLQ